MSAAPISSVFPHWIRGAITQSQEKCHFTGFPIHSQPAQTYQPLPYTLGTHTTGTYQVHNLAAPFSSEVESISQPTPPMAPENIPTDANALLVTNAAFSSVGPRQVVAGGLDPVSACALQFLPESILPFWGGNPIQCPLGPAATDDMPNLSYLVRSISSVDPDHTQHGDSWTSDHVPSLNFCHPVKPSDTIPYYNQSPPPMLTPASYLQPSVPPGPTPAEGFSPAGNPSHEPPSIRANLTASFQIPNSGSERSGSDSDKSTSLNRQIRSDRRDRRFTRRDPKPYQCTSHSITRKTRPILYEGNLERLQKRCKKQGADDGAIRLLGKIFANGVSLEALILPFMDAEAGNEGFEIGTGRAYTAFLESTNEVGVPRYICRLCHGDQTWKHTKDILRHLKRDHFGLADECGKWYVFNHLLMLASINTLFREFKQPKVLY